MKGCWVRCEQVESVATTLSLAEQNHAEELKRVCLEFVSRNLQAVMLSEGYQHMVNSCPQLQVGFYSQLITSGIVAYQVRPFGSCGRSMPAHSSSHCLSGKKTFTDSFN